MRVLFICTGNTCRSPMAEFYFNKKAENCPSFLMAVSAGIQAFNGVEASEEAVEAMRNLYDIDLSGHRSRQVEIKLIQEADLILAMTNTHKAVLSNAFPEHQEKIYTLAGYIEKITGGEQDIAIRYGIPDPYGLSLEAYEVCAKKIASLIDHLVHYLCEAGPN